MRRDDEEDYRWWWGGGGPEKLEPMATVCFSAERRSLGGLAPVSTETNSHETPFHIVLRDRHNVEKTRALRSDA